MVAGSGLWLRSSMAKVSRVWPRRGSSYAVRTRSPTMSKASPM